MNILEKIVEKTKNRVKRLKETEKEIKEQSIARKEKTISFKEALQKESIGFICEIKKASPSKGIISEEFPYLNIAKEYEKAGADAISVLTEPDFFLGSPNYLNEISKNVQIPILRKDFIIDELQIYESKIIGASAILLICSILDEQTLSKFIKITHKMGMDALVEAHDENEIAKAIKAKADIIGVNNRNLKTFDVDIKNSINLRKLVPDNIIFVSESGIKSHNQIKILEENNVNAVLIGETFMRSNDKAKSLKILKGTYSED